ncbi:von Willebrand factor A domain-containing protein 7 [Pseudorasbora parva]|uniref:von Willebrand factor A domain-containing protein 7 n=1 Tax=Pseudorasbora parva TaxID=51549 RepID=UPI00351F6D11
MRSTVLLLSLLIGAQTFHILQMPDSKNHQEITRLAILRATEKVCESVDTAFKAPEPLDSETLADACSRKDFASNFETSIRFISFYNVLRDIANIPGQYPEEHFDNETFKKGKRSITRRMKAITKKIEKYEFDDAREELGKVLHTVQDFYSHSDWIELGNTEPCTALINPEEEIPNPATKNMKTCDDSSDGPSEHIKDHIIRGKILTSGYARLFRPKGKCSHGGFPYSPDGINKDYSASSHGSLHNIAADVAINASVQLLEKILGSLTEDPALNFLRLMGLHSEMPKGEWKPLISFLNFKPRYPTATGDEYVEV